MAKNNDTTFTPTQQDIRSIPGYEGIYEIDSAGQVYTVKTGRLKKSSLHKTLGYLYINLSKNGQVKTCYIHRLVMLAFCPIENSSNIAVRHMDDDFTNNHVSNLTWREPLKYDTDSKSQRRRGYYVRNLDRNRAVMRKYYAANPAKSSEKDRKWRKSNPDKVASIAHNRRTRVAGNGGYFTARDIRIMRFIQQGHCAYCYRVGFPLHIDHIIPVKHGGPSDSWNLALACKSCNSSKGDKTLDEWVDRWYLRQPSGG